MWEMLEVNHLFDGLDDEGFHNNRFHMNEIVSLLGLPPKASLGRSPHTSRLFDETGESCVLACLELISADQYACDQEIGSLILPSKLYHWRAVQDTFLEKARRSSLTSCNQCSAGSPRRGKVQQSCSHMPGYRMRVTMMSDVRYMTFEALGLDAGNAT